MKKAILFVIDSLHPTVLGRILAEGNAPALAFLAEHGTYIEEVVSTFPTMTPVATSSMITGAGPDRHGVPGFIWYNETIRKIVDYGATWQNVLKIGTEKVIRNLLLKLNNEHLAVETPTLYEVLEAFGVSSGNINLFMHRASQPFKAKLPFSIALATGFQLREPEVFGPSHLTLGQLVHLPFSERLSAYPRGPFHRFGFNDVFSGAIARQLVQEGVLPDFTVVYFPDNDKNSHHYGPLRTAPSLELADQQIASILNEFGSWEMALEKTAIIVTGDHAQSTVGLGSEYLINLDQALKTFRRLRPMEEAEEHHEIVICPNERMTFIYVLQRREVILPQVVDILSRDVRNAQISWKIAENKYTVLQGGTKSQLSFSRGGPILDVYGQSWSYDGDLSVVDAKVTDRKMIEFGKYPDAFSRLISALEARQGDRVVVSALSGFEYYAEGAPTHPGGGSHGSLEKEDSTVPMIVTGMPFDLKHPRIVDLFPLILRYFGIEK
ncbi:type I phosphodiesterase / nucleotide pyrophosphatase [Desulfosporosinus acididurans]|uniref:Type I phosphodiesterase / nucleotide pyrophosphatase n=1 Tax=Desulfosporosinus acididurans TaxID=476652 RepID=A0A0J1FNL8_9FIRM|nr:alkaline phosphatase family protein [Desulfosporosinus acididurans]KLU64942.1 type I phosphodiesterase / nucleotide pyrophosphatase [Desulfosporosinus acididurans]